MDKIQVRDPSCGSMLHRPTYADVAVPTLSSVPLWAVAAKAQTTLSLAHPDAAIHEFLSRSADPALSPETNNLGRLSLFAKNNQDTHWAGKKMADLLNQHRKAHVAVTGKVQKLLKLNP